MSSELVPGVLGPNSTHKAKITQHADSINGVSFCGFIIFITVQSQMCDPLKFSLALSTNHGLEAGYLSS